MHFIAAALRREAGAELKTSIRSAAIAEPATLIESKAGIAHKAQRWYKIWFWRQM